MLDLSDAEHPEAMLCSPGLLPNVHSKVFSSAPAFPCDCVIPPQTTVPALAPHPSLPHITLCLKENNVFQIYLILVFLKTMFKVNVLIIALLPKKTAFNKSQNSIAQNNIKICMIVLQMKIIYIIKSKTFKT